MDGVRECSNFTDVHASDQLWGEFFQNADAPVIPQGFGFNWSGNWGAILVKIPQVSLPGRSRSICKQSGMKERN